MVLRRTCLKPHYSLRYQLWICFGSISTIAILVIVSTSIAISVIAGRRVQHHAEFTLEEQVIRTVRLSSKSVADTISRRVSSLAGIVAILAQVTQDRIVGDGWESDRSVPFVNLFTGQPQYPLAPVYLPPDWNITVTNDGDYDYKEHVQEGRKKWYESRRISTAHATFRFQGQCDPSSVEGEDTYYPNCTSANNNVSTCGAVWPIESKLHEKVGFLQYILKPLYEAHLAVQLLGVYFVNRGAGASVVYPPHVVDGTKSYTSAGCDWMINNTNPHTARPFGSLEQIEKCRASGVEVPSRNYNPLERSWCQQQALAGGRPIMYGPYLDAFSDNLWLVSFGQAVFDRETGEFLACTLVDVATEHIHTILVDLAQEYTSVVLLQWKDGEVIAGGEPTTEGELLEKASNARTNESGPVKFTDHPDASDADFESLKQSSLQSKGVLLTNLTGRIVAAYPIPEVPPNNTESASYTPQALLVMSVSQDVFRVVESVEKAVSGDISKIVAIAAGLGGVGLFVVLFLIWLVAHCLTHPFQWMENTARRILYSEVMEESVSDTRPLLRWTPKTEITTLVEGFRSMIQGFSGDGPASIATDDRMHEVSNSIECLEDFGQLYWRNDTNEMLDESSEGNATDDNSEGDMKDTLLALPEAATEITTARSLNFDEPLSCDVSMQFGLSLKSMQLSGNKSFQSSRRLLIDDLMEITTSSVSSSQVQVSQANDEIDEAKDHESPDPSVTPSTKFPRIPKRIHSGSNINVLQVTEHKQRELLKAVTRLPSIRRSPLFWWIVILIVIPLLVTIFVITEIVTRKVTHTLPALLDETRQQSLALEEAHAGVVARSRATFATEVLDEPNRDLHLFKRVAEWLLTGVIQRTDAFPFVDEAAEECKTYPADESCPYFADKNRTPCDCEWEYPSASCDNYDADPRRKQMRFWLSQRHDADPLTGHRNSTSYPLLDTTPDNTSWWSNIREVPGAQKGTSAAGYETTYDRIRVLAAIAVVEFPIVNYNSGELTRIKHLGLYIAFEADGLLTGSSGCDHTVAAESAHFRSSLDNGAYLIRPELCPLGKYGLDPRCRGWYADGKALGKTHLTAPYRFATSKEVASSITAPMYDPMEDNKYIGQALMDFIPDGLVTPISSIRFGPTGSGVVIMITPAKDVLGGDTVVAPDYVFGEEPSPAIHHLVLPHDDADSKNRLEFLAIVDDMKNGSTGNASFTRTVMEGDEYKEEVVAIFYAPVRARTVQTVNSSSYPRGVRETNTTVYSVGVLIPKGDLTSAFSDSIEGELWGLIVVYLVIAALTGAVLTIIAAMVAILVTRPVKVLCSIVKRINEDDIQDDIPPMNGGSREVNQVYTSFAKLYKIVRFSNTAYFSGNMESALKFLTDALELYRNVDDQKAIGICCNNLGNTYLSLYLSKRSESGCFCVNGKCVKAAAYDCYTEAIEVATRDYEFAVSDVRVNDATRSEYAQQLANRYFNRGVFSFLTKYDACTASVWEDFALHDLESAAKLDTDVRDFWIRTRSVTANSERYFERLIRRGAGMVMALDADPAFVDTLLHEADSLLCCIGKDDEAPLIQNVKLSGRLQQLEEVAIRNELQQGNIEDAARFAIRMLMEDEYLVESAFCAAAEALLQCMETCHWLVWNPDTIETTTKSIRDMLHLCRGPVSVPSLAKNVVLCLDPNVQASEESLAALREGAVKLYHSTCRDHDQVGLMVLGDDSAGFALQHTSGYTTRKIDALATYSSPGQRIDSSVGFLLALDMAEHLPSYVVEERNVSQTWLVLATDGESWSDWKDWNAVHSRLVARDKSIHILVVGIHMKSEHMRSNFRSICRERQSAFLETTSDDARSISDAFAEAATVMKGGYTLRGLTTEKF